MDDLLSSIRQVIADEAGSYAHPTSEDAEPFDESGDGLECRIVSALDRALQRDIPPPPPERPPVSGEALRTRSVEPRATAEAKGNEHDARLLCEPDLVAASPHAPTAPLPCGAVSALADKARGRDDRESDARGGMPADSGPETSMDVGTAGINEATHQAPRAPLNDGASGEGGVERPQSRGSFGSSDNELAKAPAMPPIRSQPSRSIREGGSERKRAGSTAATDGQPSALRILRTRLSSRAEPSSQARSPDAQKDMIEWRSNAASQQKNPLRERTEGNQNAPGPRSAGDAEPVTPAGGRTASKNFWADAEAERPTRPATVERRASVANRDGHHDWVVPRAPRSHSPSGSGRNASRDVPAADVFVSCADDTVHASSANPIEAPAEPGGPQKAQTLQDHIAEMVRPMVREWLEAHVASVVERQVRAEFERWNAGRSGARTDGE